MAQAEGPVGNIEGVAAPVSCFTSAEVPPESPVVWAVGWAIGPCLCRPQPEIPDQLLGDRWKIGWDRRHPPASSLKRIDLRYLPDHAALDRLNRAAHPGIGVALVSKLGSYLHPAGDPCQFPAFPGGVRQGLLAVDMFSHQHGLPCRVKVRMIGSTNYHGVDGLLHLIEHPAEITVLPGLRKARPVLTGPLLVHVTDGHDILSSYPSEISSSLPSYPDAGYVKLIVWRGGTNPGRGPDPVARPKGGGGRKEMTPIRLMHVEFYPLLCNRVNPPK